PYLFGRFFQQIVLAFVVTAAGAVTAEKRAAMSHAGHEVPAAHDLTEHKGLNEGALTFFGTLMIGLASVAPAYSLAATLGYVVIEDGTLAPVAVVLGFIPMLLTEVGLVRRLGTDHRGDHRAGEPGPGRRAVHLPDRRRRFPGREQALGDGAGRRVHRGHGVGFLPRHRDRRVAAE